jgi:hypothetical protein
MPLAADEGWRQVCSSVWCLSRSFPFPFVPSNKPSAMKVQSANSCSAKVPQFLVCREQITNAVIEFTTIVWIVTPSAPFHCVHTVGITTLFWNPNWQCLFTAQFEWLHLPPSKTWTTMHHYHMLPRQHLATGRVVTMTESLITRKYYILSFIQKL